MNINRNDECWCKSGLKYKKCHMSFDEKLNELKRSGFEVLVDHFVQLQFSNFPHTQSMVYHFIN